MTIPTHSLDHVERGLSRLIERYKDSDTIKGILRPFLEECQRIEDHLWDVIESRIAATAVGVQLTTLSDIVNQPVVSTDDDVQRAFVKARIAVNRSDGSIPALIHIVSLISAATFYVIEHQDHLRFVFDGAEDLITPLTRLLGEARSAGVVLRTLHSSAPANMFRYGFTGLTIGFGFGFTGSPAIGGRPINVQQR